MKLFSAALGRGVSGLEEAFNARDITSAEMKKAVLNWFELYFSDCATETEDSCQRLPYVVVNKLYKAAFSEYEAEADGKDEQLPSLLAALNEVKKKAMQTALIGGECFLKPVFTESGPIFTVLRRDCYLVFARDRWGRPSDIGCSERSAAGGKFYTLMERRSIGADGRLTIQNRLFRSDSGDTPGSEVPLNALDRYAALRPVMTLPEPCGLGMAHLKTPMENCVDGSEDGVSVYAPAVGLIRNINRNEAQLNGEFERGESRIIASADMMELDESGNRRRLAGHLFTGVDQAPDEVGITIFSPALREASFLARKTEYLRNVETQIGLKRGILSEVEAAERTATEVTSSEGDYNLTILDFQQMWEAGAREALQISAALGRMYGHFRGALPDVEKRVVFQWGNGVLYDADRDWAETMQMVEAGMLRPELALAWKYKLPCETPADLEKIRGWYMPELRAMTGGD